MFAFFEVVILLALYGLTLAEVDMSKICLNRNLGDILPHPVDCSAYIVCGLPAVLHHCDRGLHFDARQKVCNWPQFSNCPQSLSTDEITSNVDDINVLPLVAIEIQTGKVVLPMKDFNPENVMCRHYGAYFLAHPQLCRSYYLCAYGRMHQGQCGKGALWSYKRQQCEISYKAECYHKTKEEEKEINELIKECSTPGATTTQGQTTNSFHPTGSYHTATAAETTAGSLYPTSQVVATTTDGQTMNIFHPTGSYYTPAETNTTENINSSSSSTSSDHPTTTSKPFSITGTSSATFHPTGSIYAATGNTTTERTLYSTISKFPSSSKTPNSSNPYFLECPQGRQTYLAHPKNCSKYYMCIKGRPIQTSCPNGLLWDANKSFCALPQYVKCFQ